MSQALQDEVKELHWKKYIVTNHMKPWTNKEMNLSQDLDAAVKNLNQTLQSVTLVREGPTSKNIVDIMKNAME